MEPKEQQLDNWKCLKCGEEIETVSGARPTICPNPNCKNRSQRCFAALTGPWRFFDENRFIPKRLAEQIMKKHRFATHRESWIVYRYNGGHYTQDGEALIREECRGRLGELAKEHYVNEVVSHIRDTTFREPADFNPPLNLICVENGVFDLDARELKPHTPDLIFLHKLSVSYDPKARAPRCGKHLCEWMSQDDVIRAIQFVGFCLLREYFIRKMCILVGEGGNGKTTFLTWLTRWVGAENVSSVPVQDLDRNRFAAAGLHGKLGNFCDDLPNVGWFQTGRCKQATGGSPMQMEMKFHDPFNAYLYAKMLFTANVLPLVIDDTRAFWERIMIISFPNHFDGSEPRERILEEMLTPEERSGILNASLVGLGMLRRRGEFYKPENIEAVRSRYIHLSDPVAAFVEDCIVEDPNGAEPKEELYIRYVRYCREHGFSPAINSVFSKLLRKRVQGVRETRIMWGGERIRAWSGIRLKEAQEIEAAEVADERTDAREDVQDVQDILYFISICNDHRFSFDKEIKNTLDSLDTLDATALPNLFVLPIKGERETALSIDQGKPTLVALKRRLWNAFGTNPFKPSQLPKHFSDDELVRLTSIMDHMRERGELMVVSLPSGERAWQLVVKP